MDRIVATSRSELSSPDHRFTLLVDAVEEYAIFMLGPDGTVLTWNTGGQRIKGYSAEEIIGRHFSTFYPPEDVSSGKPERELAHAAEHGQCRDEGWRVRKDGSRFWANVVITALRDGDGRLDGYAKVTRDETDRKNAEEQVRILELLNERERIADDLLQTIVRRIIDAGFLLQGTLSLVHDPIAAGRIRDAIDLLDDTMVHVRTVVLDLEGDNA